MTEEITVQEMIQALDIPDAGPVEPPPDDKPRPSFKRPAKTEKAEAKPVAKAEPKPAKATKAEAKSAAPAVAPPSPTNGFSEIADLIEIKRYVDGIVNGGYNIDKAKFKDIQKVQLLMDNKIIDALLGDKFKAFINFEDADKAVKAAAWNSNIKSTLPAMYR